VVNLVGVTGVINHIKIRANKHDKVEKAAIENAIDLNWSLSDRNIEVNVSDNKVTLTGTVDSWKAEYEFELAG
jgi:osmotically-inducible protein OsmY